MFIGVNKIFGISNSAASRLKNAAVKEKFLQLKKNYSNPIKDIVTEKELNRLYDSPKNIVFSKGSYRLRLIDTIYPLFYFIKRKNLKT